MSLRRNPPSSGQGALDRRHAEYLEWGRWAVSRWAAFPVDADPRPTVLLGQRVFGDGGFRTGDAKESFIDGLFAFEVDVPARVVAALPSARVRPARGRPAPPPLRIVGAESSATEFRTDRGRRRLPAWRLTAIDAIGPIWVLDPDLQPPEWRPPEPPPLPRPQLQMPGQDPGIRVDVAPDDRTLTLHFIGAAPAFEEYPRAEVIESDRAVTIVPEGRDIGPSGWRTLAGYMHQITVRLARPVGARVFVDLHGEAGEAVSSAD